MTDALAHWCLVEAEAGRNPWTELELLCGSPLTRLRASGDSIPSPAD